MSDYVGQYHYGAPKPQKQDPDIRRIRDSQADTGRYLVLKNDKVEHRVDDFVTAEVIAHRLAREAPGYRIVVAQASIEFKGVPHVYEVHRKG